MAEHAQEQRIQRKSSDVAPSTLLIAALASVAATAIVSRFGLESTLIGAGLTPVVVTIVREIARRPVEQVGAITASAGSWRHWRHQQAEAPADDPAAAPPPRPVPPAPPRPARIRWGIVGSASIVGFLAAVAFFTVPDLIAGESVVSGRDSTFFSGGDSGPKEPVAAPTETTTTETETTPTTTAPEETETETVTVTSTAPTATAPPPDPPAPVAPPAGPAPTPTPPPAPTP